MLCTRHMRQLSNRILRCQRLSVACQRIVRRTPPTCSRLCSTETAIEPPAFTGEIKNYAPKIHHIVDDISKLTLLEVADLNDLLKTTLNIPDAPMMAMGAMAAAPAAAQEDEEVAAPVKEKTAFTVKLLKFDEGKKVQLIKQIKSLIPGMNLVQSKKFVESTPQVIKANISKEEAEELKETVTTAGGMVEIE